MSDILFIIEEPYVSDLMLKTLEKNKFKVYANDFAKKSSYKLNLTDRIEGEIYSNSENAISLISGSAKDTPVKNYINLCKDKYLMRQKLKPIYPEFFFDEVSLDDIDEIDVSKLPEKFIIKPSVGFLSIGVHKVCSCGDWEKTKESIKNEVHDFEKNFPESVLSSSKFIIEEVIEGVEFAIDAYFDNNGQAVIINIFKHPFISEDDVSDRAYITSKEIIEENLADFEYMLNKISAQTGFKNYPVHIEVIKRKDGAIIPVEINPMRFAGWCTTDLAFYAYGINVYEYFAHSKKPDWKSILKDKASKIYYFAMAETPSGIDKTKIKFDYDGLQKEFSKILDYRKIDFINKPVFAVIFGEAAGRKEINHILSLEMKNFINKK